MSDRLEGLTADDIGTEEDREAKFAWDEGEIEITPGTEEEKAFDPDQPRDEQGQWTSGGGSSGGSSESGESGGGDEGASHPVSRAVAKVEKSYPPANPDGKDTLERHKLASGGFTPERKELHDQIVGKLRAGKAVSENKTYLLMGGGPASGKSSVLKSGQVEVPVDSVHIDSDSIKAELPEYAAMNADKDLRSAAFAHEESSHLAKRTQAESFQAGQNVLLDGTGNASVESVEAKVSAARASGYNVHGEYVTCSVDEALRRNLARAQKTGRLPPEDMLRRTHASVSRVLPAAVEKGLFDKVRLWDSEQLTDGKPTLVMSAVGTTVEIHNQELWERFKAKGQ